MRRVQNNPESHLPNFLFFLTSKCRGAGSVPVTGCGCFASSLTASLSVRKCRSSADCPACAIGAHWKRVALVIEECWQFGGHWAHQLRVARPEPSDKRALDYSERAKQSGGGRSKFRREFQTHRAIRNEFGRPKRAIRTTAISERRLGISMEGNDCRQSF